MANEQSILVTGGAGYLGSILVPELLAAGHRVTVLDNFMYLQNSLAQCCANAKFDVINGDARSADHDAGLTMTRQQHAQSARFEVELRCSGSA